MNRLVDLFDSEKIGITVQFPTVNGVFNNGILAAIGALMNYFFVLLVLIFVVFCIYGAFKISMSKGDPKEMETGFNLIKNVWISVAWGIVFFIVASIVGTFLGIGNITQWYYQLAQCHDSSGGFYFRDIAAQEQEGIPDTNVYCCKITSAAAMPTIYKEVKFQDNSWHYIAVASGGQPSGVEQCETVK